MSVCEIIPKLWLGNINICKNRLFLTNNNIKIIINCSCDIPFFSNKTKNIRISVNDNLKEKEIEKLYHYLDKSADTIYKYLQNNQPILVHCYAGKQRSASVVVAFLMKYARMSLKDSILAIKSKRVKVFTPGINFIKPLEKYEKYLKVTL